MKLLLCTNIDKLGIVGDIVDVAAGYGRNYLLPVGLATEPTEGNIRALAEARKTAELEREHKRAELVALAEQLKEVEVIIEAKVNETGALYGSVGRREIAAAMVEAGHYVKEEQVMLAHPIRQVDTVEVEIRLGEDLTSSVKVWVVRDKTDASQEDQEVDAEHPAGTEAGSDDHDANE